jgi:hypothetical protein
MESGVKYENPAMAGSCSRLVFSFYYTGRVKGFGGVAWLGCKQRRNAGILHCIQNDGVKNEPWHTITHNRFRAVSPMMYRYSKPQIPPLRCGMTTKKAAEWQAKRLWNDNQKGCGMTSKKAVE